MKRQYHRRRDHEGMKRRGGPRKNRFGLTPLPKAPPLGRIGRPKKPKPLVPAQRGGKCHRTGARPSGPADGLFFDDLVTVAMYAHTRPGEVIAEARSRPTLWKLARARLKLADSQKITAALMRNDHAQLVPAERLGLWRFVRLFPGERKLSEIHKRLRAA